MIAAGTKLIMEFHWVLYVFGVFLILTGIKMLFAGTGQPDPDRNIVVRIARRIFPITSNFHGEHFLVRAGRPSSFESEQPGKPDGHDEKVEQAKAGTLMMTPLALALIVVETTDLIFAVDSIPAIFAITADPFLIFTSNVFAILGLRSLYFALAGLIDKFKYLKVSLSFILVLVGVKMLAAERFKALLGQHFNYYLLAIVLLILACGVVVSLLANRRKRHRSA
jgi:tellurite resistance protein TerC